MKQHDLKQILSFLSFLAFFSVYGQTAPTFTSTPITMVNEESPYNYIVTATDAEGDAISITAPTLPSWLSLTTETIATTVAGSSTQGSANGTGTSAQFSRPNGIAIDAAGNMYITDTRNHQIRKITPAGVVTTFAGSSTQGFADGTGTAAQFYWPIGITIDATGNLYVADVSNHKIRKITPAGVVTTFAGSSRGFADGTGTAAQFSGPQGVVIDKSSGNLYVADRDNQRIRKVTPAGVVSTFAGSSSRGFADGTGTAAEFNRPSGIAVDASGNVYVADSNNHRIRKITPAGVVSTLAGSGTDGFADGTGTATEFNYPTRVAVDANNNIYVADRSNHRIRKITPSGVVTTFAGSGTYGFADGIGADDIQVNSPSGLIVDDSGNLFVADENNHKIRKLVSESVLSGDTTGYVGTHSVSLKATDAGGLFSNQNFTITVIDVIAPLLLSTTPANNATSVALDANLVLVFNENIKAGTGNILLRKTSDGRIVTSISATDATQVSISGATLTINPTNDLITETLYYVEIEATAIQDIYNNAYVGISNATTFNFNTFPPTAPTFTSSPIISIEAGTYYSYKVETTDVNGDNIIVSAPTLPSWLSITNEARVSTLAGSGTDGFADGTGTAAEFNYPTGTAVDASGNVYVADSYNHRIRKITPAGVVSTFAGSGTDGFADGTGTAAEFYSPTGVAVDASGNVYVADSDNNRIRKITPAGVVSTFAGSGTDGFADGTGTAAEFYYPTGVAVDASGNVYVADQYNHRIRKITPAGIVSTLAGSGTDGFADGTGAAAEFYYPIGVAVDALGNVYVADSDNNRIRKITPAGVVSTLAGSGTDGFADGTGTAAEFNYPTGVAVDVSGNVYVADQYNHRIRKITPAGIVSTLAGSSTDGDADGVGTAAEFYYPNGIAAGADGNLYVAGYYGHNIRKIELGTILSGDTTGQQGTHTVSLKATDTGGLFSNQNYTITVSTKSITYGGSGFDENPANDGTLSGSITATLEGNNYSGSNLSIGTDVTLGNIPAGLTPTMAVAAGGSNWTAALAAEANAWLSVTYGNGKFVAVARRGTNRVMTSPDGITWTAVAAAEANQWYSVTYGDGKFVAVAIDGTNRVMTSPDGMNWTAVAAAEANEWHSVTYGNGKFVAVARSGTNRVMTSPDGMNWTAVAAAEANEWLSVIYGDGKFVAVAIDGTNRVMTSPDGTTWTAVAAAEANQWYSVTYGNGKFVAVAANGNNRVMTSTDGITWAARAATEANGWASVTYGNGKFVAVAASGTNQVMTSTDGITWTAAAAAEANQWFSVTYGNGQFVAVALSGTNRVMTANANAIATLTLSGTATNHANANDVSDITFNFANSAFSGGNASAINNATGPASSNLGIDFDDPPSITYGGTGFDENSANDGTVSGSITATLEGDSYNGSTNLSIGTDVTLGNIPAGLTPTMAVAAGGSNWTAAAAAEQNPWLSVTYGNGKFVAVAQFGTNRVMTSTDGITWTAAAAAEANDWGSVTYGNGQFVAVAFNGTNRVMTSPDGMTWTAAAAAEQNEWRSVTYGNGQFVAVAQNGTNRVMTSTDGITWTARAAAEANSWRSVTYGNGQFVAVANNGTNRVMTSTDGMTWTAVAAAEANFWQSVTYGNGKFVAVANGGSGTNLVMTSLDGMTWTAAAAAEANQWLSVTYGNGQFVAVASDGTNRVMTSPDGITWTAAAAEANTWSSVTYGNGQFVAVTYSGTNRVMTANANAVATLTLSGTATNHANANDVSDITFNFANSAFSGGNASIITNATGPASSNLGIDFDDPPSITYGGTGFDENSANDGTVSGSITATLEGDNYNGSTNLSIGTDVTLGNIPAGLTPTMAVAAGGSNWTAAAAAEQNPWLSVTYGNGKFVAVAQFGTNRVMTSTDGITWTAAAAAEANDWGSVTYGNGQFVAVAFNGTNRVMTSPDGMTWTAAAAAEQNEWRSVTYGNGQFVAVAQNGTNRVMTSTDGITWTARAAAEANSWRSVTYGNGQFVAVANNGTNRVMTSTDGMTWTARAAAEANFWQSVTYGNGKFVAVANGGSGTNLVMTSLDGMTWTAAAAAEANQWLSVTYGNGQFVAVASDGTNRVMASTDGITWTAVAATEANLWFSVTYGNGQFVAVAAYGTNLVMTANANAIATLTLSGTATNHANANDVSDITFNFANSAFSGGNASAITNATGPASSNLGVDFDDNPTITYGGAGFDENTANDGTVSGSITATLEGDNYSGSNLSIGTDVTLGNIPAGLTPTMAVAAGGSNWTAALAAEANAWLSVTYGNGQFVAVAFDGTNRVMTSPDGMTWTAAAATEANQWFSVTYGNGQFVAVALNGTNRVMTSPDGITWTAAVAAEANQWYSVTYGNGQFVAVAANGTNRVMTSTDGMTWTARAAAEQNSWLSVTYGNGQFVAVADNGTNRLMTSTDGMTWTARAAAEANSWTSVTYGNGQFVAVATSGTNRVMTSTDGMTWTAAAAAEANPWSSVTYGNGQFVAVATSGTNRVMTSTDGMTWTAVAATEANQWRSVTYGNGQFVAVALNGTNRVMTANANAVATLTLSGTATNHANANDISDITFNFANSAFSGGNASAITNATGPASSNLGIDFDDPPSITYGGAGFDENTANDGTLSGSITATLEGDNYNGSTNLSIGTDVTLGNIPAGLTPTMAVAAGGSNWTAAAAAEQNPWLSVTYGNGKFVAVATSGTNRVMTSTDGMTWTAALALAAEADSWTAVTYGNGKFVAVAYNGTNRVMTSPDGITWTAAVAAEANQWTSVTYGNGKFVAVANNGTNRVMTSTDGMTWTARAATEQNFWQSVTYGNGKFVAVAVGTNRVMTSPDGMTWTAAAAAEANLWQSVTYGNGKFVAVARGGTNLVMTSPDGMTWTAVAAAEANFWQSVTYGNGQFVAVAGSGANRVMTSPDGMTWTAVAATEANAWRSVTYGNGQFVAVALNGTNRVMTANANAIATLTLSGTATNHANANDVSDITFNFANSAFSGGNASTITNATGPASSNLGIDFDDPVVLAIEDESLSLDLSLKIYPIPVTNILNIQIDNSNHQIETITLHNILGKVVYSKTYTSPKINVSYLNSGVYFITIKTNKSKTIKKIIKN